MSDNPRVLPLGRRSGKATIASIVRSIDRWIQNGVGATYRTQPLPESLADVIAERYRARGFLVRRDPDTQELIIGLP